MSAIINPHCDNAKALDSNRWNQHARHAFVAALSSWRNQSFATIGGGRRVVGPLPRAVDASALFVLSSSMGRAQRPIPFQKRGSPTAPSRLKVPGLNLVQLNLCL